VTEPDNFVHLLRVKVELHGDATGEYVFKSAISPAADSFFIFAQSE